MTKMMKTIAPNPPVYATHTEHLALWKSDPDIFYPGQKMPNLQHLS